jgi:hypothetical protein
MHAKLIARGLDENQPGRRPSLSRCASLRRPGSRPLADHVTGRRIYYATRLVQHIKNICSRFSIYAGGIDQVT